MKHKVQALFSVCIALIALVGISGKALAILPTDPDLNGDGSADLIWQNTSTGDVTTWYMAGGEWSGSYDYLASRLDTAWKIVGTADLNGDHQSDLIWQNLQTGDVAFWLMNGINRADNGYIAYGVPLNWKIVGTVDVDNDGHADLLWQDTQSGDIVVWYMNGTQWTGIYDYLARGVPTQWRIAGTGIFQVFRPLTPGIYQIIFQNSLTGDVSYWTMNGTSITSSDYLVRNVPLNWKLAAIADLSGDSASDLIWQNRATGDVSYWFNISLSGSYDAAFIANGIPLQWSIVPTH